ncbi:hypothetical protein ACFQE1_03665 [Halobium palmae]|uniref:GAF domain-containing protein n=1 Tax=Halobium palmae TaxID=1776492 RepID=A0ABD5RW61_9EURY
MLQRLPYISPRLAILFDSLVTAIAVGASLFFENPSTEMAVSVVLIAFIASALVSYATQYQSTMRLREDTRETILDMVLEQLTRKYSEEIAACELRANIMTIKRKPSKRIPPWRRSLSFRAMEGDYSDAELEQEYNSGIGCSGKTIERNSPTYYDSERRQDPDRTLSSTQREVTNHVNSILSVPIYPDNDPSKAPIGVLSLDSEENINTTSFHEEPAHRLAMKYAGVVGNVLS